MLSGLRQENLLLVLRFKLQNGEIQRKYDLICQVSDKNTTAEHTERREAFWR